MGFLGQTLETDVAKIKYYNSTHSEYIIRSLANSLASLHLYSYVASLGCSLFGCNLDDFSLPGASQGGVSPDDWRSWWL